MMPNLDNCQMFATRPRRLKPLSAARAEKAFREFSQKLAASQNLKLLEQINSAPGVESFLASVFSLSPYLLGCALLDTQMFADIAHHSFEKTKAKILSDCAIIGRHSKDEAEVMCALRKHKKKVALLCGLADLGGWWSGKTVTATLSDFADAALSASLDFILLEQHNNNKLVLADSANPQRQSGFIVLGMGKHGARELNYSSDIDLILFFDDSAKIKLLTDDPVTLFGRMARQLVKIMQERTGDGYVFRMDLRLRPDPASTPPVLPIDAALNYYEGQGQNWERAALIKARPVAGDIEAGMRCLKDLSPFIWRKYLDYAAIQDVHSIKRQIHAHKGHGDIAVAGHNIKLGRGGIREIEFFAQTQQLIAGGRNQHLRSRSTIEALGNLSECGWISSSALKQLTQAYWYLRNLEHRLQMVSDEQTHTLPEAGDELKRIACLMGESGVAAFSRNLVKVLKSVERHYAELFEAEAELSTINGNLVFTGDDEDPDTLKTLQGMGYHRPSDIIKIIRGWHFGRVPALQTAQARGLLTELAPRLLEEFAETGNPDEAIFAFENFVSGLPAGIQLFAILNSNPALTSLLVRILGTAPRLSDAIARRPHIFDGLLDPRFMDTIADRMTLITLLNGDLERSGAYEAALDQARRFFSEQKFLIGVRCFAGSLTSAQAGQAFSNLAEVILASLLALVQTEFEKAHGKISGGRVCILAMGRLGSRELTAISDLDLIFLYNHDKDARASDGKKPLQPSHYFVRLTQRLITAMSAPTAEGIIYELDFRLRPSGNSGPLATHVDGFMKYQMESAWVWEAQALTRARPVAGNRQFCDQVTKDIRKIITTAGANASLSTEIRDMRMRIEKEKGSTDPWDVKNVKGGLIDIEFIAQWIVLTDGPMPGDATDVRNIISAAASKIITNPDCETLLGAFDLYRDVLQLQRICLGTDIDVENAPSGFIQTMCAMMDLPDLANCEAHLKAFQSNTRDVFNKLLPVGSKGKTPGRKAARRAAKQPRKKS